jgi:hypothetical protein
MRIPTGNLGVNKVVVKVTYFDEKICRMIQLEDDHARH